MAHVIRSDLGSPDSDGVYRMLDDYPDSFRLGPSRNLCPNQKFLQHPRLSYCSATLVGNSHVITAAHCVWNQMLCDDAAFVFNYYVTGYDDNGNPKFPAITRDDVFFCKSVSTNYREDSSGYSSGTDIAYITLDRAVPGRTPATYHKTLVRTTPRQKLLMIGFPDGLPAKVEAGARSPTSGRIPALSPFSPQPTHSEATLAVASSTRTGR